MELSKRMRQLRPQVKLNLRLQARQTKSIGKLRPQARQVEAGEADAKVEAADEAKRAVGEAETDDAGECDQAEWVCKHCRVNVSMRKECCAALHTQ